MKHLRVFLVNGTWPKGPPFWLWLKRLFPWRRSEPKCWYEEDSDFWEHLSSSLRMKMPDADIRLESAPWGGANSHRKRMIAAKELRSQLNRNAEKEPNAIRIVVAHSHGGDVALSAVKMTTANDPA